MQQQLQLHKQRDPFFQEMVKRKSGAHKSKKHKSKQGLRKQKHKGTKGLYS